MPQSAKAQHFPLDHEAMRFAFAATLMTRKNTPKAVRRCRKRLVRAVRELESGEQSLDPVIAQAACGVLRVGCRMCGKCQGLTVTPPPPLNRRG